jgi:hypothetical protein
LSGHRKSEILADRCIPGFSGNAISLIDLHPSLFVIGVAVIAAPLPLLWFEQQSALQRIAMHIAQLLDPLALAPRIEIVEAARPDVWRFRAKLGLALGSAGPARGCEDQRQNLIAFGFGNAHPPAKIAFGFGMPTLSQTARKDGAPAPALRWGVKINVKILWRLDLGCPPSREERGKGGPPAGLEWGRLSNLFSCGAGCGCRIPRGPSGTCRRVFAIHCRRDARCRSSRCVPGRWT